MDTDDDTSDDERKQLHEEVLALDVISYPLGSILF